MKRDGGNVRRSERTLADLHREVVPYTFRKSSLAKWFLTREPYRKKMPFCPLMSKLNIITQVLSVPLMEGLEEEIIHFLYDSFFSLFHLWNENKQKFSVL